MKRMQILYAHTTTLQKKVSEPMTNEHGAIDLASIMSGIIVIGLIGGVIAATVFAVVPWAQDNAAKQQLDSIATAESSHMGFSSDPSSLPAGSATNSYGDSAKLETAGFLKQSKTYCVVETSSGKGYSAYSKSGSGKVWSSTDSNPQPVIFNGTLPSACQFIAGNPEAAAYVDPTPQTTILTLNCPTNVTASIPMQYNMVGTETWSDGVTATYDGDSLSTGRTLSAGVEYKVTFTGTYGIFDSRAIFGKTFASCLRSVDHWGLETGVTSASNAFKDAINLTSVPAHIPSTITDAWQMFNGASQINDPNISQWDTSNFNTTYRMFAGATAFNQPLNDWKMSNVTNMIGMFNGASSFNQPLNKWDTSNCWRMTQTFMGATSFNQDLSKWDVTNVFQMDSMFNGATAFNGSVTNWKTGNVTTMSGMFFNATSFNQPLNSWDTSKVTTMQSMFTSAAAFNQPLDSWDTSNVTNMNEIFRDASAFNGNISSWDTSNISNMDSMFLGASAFNSNISNWKTGNVTTTNSMFRGASSFNQNLNWDTSKVTDMESMFLDDTAFNGDISSWNTSQVTTMYQMFHLATAFNGNISSWNTSQVTDMSRMFLGATAFNKNISNWNTTSLTSGNYFVPSAFPVAYMPPNTSKS